MSVTVARILGNETLPFHRLYTSRPVRGEEIIKESPKMSPNSHFCYVYMSGQQAAPRALQRPTCPHRRACESSQSREVSSTCLRTSTVWTWPDIVSSSRPRPSGPCRGPLLRPSSWSPPSPGPTRGSHSCLASGLKALPSTAAWKGGQYDGWAALTRAGRKVAPTSGHLV